MNDDPRVGDCQQTLRELDAFLDGEISAITRVQIHSHLDSCLDCLSAYDFHAELRQAIRRKCSNDEIPPGLLSRIERCLQEDFDGDGSIG